MALDEFDNPSKARLHVGGQRLNLVSNAGIEQFNDPRHPFIVLHFCNITGLGQTLTYNACLQLTFIDWAVVALYFLFNLGIGLYYKSRAGKSMDEFFLSGRNIPWWLAGTSMVATTFAADTP